jgi:hypothetical protein
MDENELEAASQDAPQPVTGPAPIEPQVPARVPAPARRRTFYLAGAALLIILLAAAAYVGTGWLSRPAARTVGGSGLSLLQKGAGGQSNIQLHIQNAPELPATEPDVFGVLTRRNDNSLFVGTGQVTMRAIKSASSGAQAQSTPSFNGPVVEVVVTHDTQIYRDETDLGMPKAAANGQASIQQVVKPGSLDDITTNSVVQAWGEKRGDRIIARVLSYRTN